MELRKYSTAQRFMPLMMLGVLVLRFLAILLVLSEEELKFVVDGCLTPDLIYYS